MNNEKLKVIKNVTKHFIYTSISIYINYIYLNYRNQSKNSTIVSFLNCNFLIYLI